jgi:hypothetical protein
MSQPRFWKFVGNGIFGTFFFTYTGPSIEALTFLTGWVFMAATCTVVLGGNLNIPHDETFAHKILKSLSRIV